MIKRRGEYRIRLRQDTIKQIKLMALILNRPDWHEVLDDVARIGVAYLNRVAKMNLADWKGEIKLYDLGSEMDLTIIKGDLPPLEDE